MTETHPRPLHGLRILDFSTTIAGPHCSRLLADMGADVIKVESPEGDLMRSRPVQRNGAGTMFGQLNAGKRSIVLDLKSTPVIEYRMRYCEDLEEALFVQMTMGDDRAVLATYIAGKLAYSRPEQQYA